METFFQIFFEIFGEAAIGLLARFLIELIQLVSPGKKVSEKTKQTIEKIISMFSTLLVVVLMLGLLILVGTEDLVMKNIGNYMTLIPLSIIALQVVVGIFAKIIKEFKK